MNRIIRHILFAALLLAACVPGLGARAQTVPGLASASLVSETGQPVRLSDYRGRVVFVNVWGSWCTPCLQEMQSIKALQSSLGGEIAFVFVSSRPGELQKDSAWLRQHGIVGTSVAMPGGSKGLYVPSTYILDRSGAVAQYRSSAVDWQLHADFIRGLMQRHASM